MRASPKPRRFLTGLVVIVALFSLFVTPALGERGTDSAEFEYHAADLLKDGAVEVTGREATLVLEGTATEGDRILISLEGDERDAFEITGVADETDDIGVAARHTSETIEIELTDLDGSDTVTDAEISIGIDLRAFETIASDAAIYDETTVGAVDEAETDVDLDGENAIVASVVEAAEIGFTAEEIDEYIDGSMNETNDYDQFALSFAKDDVVVDDGDTINISIDPDVIKEDDKSSIGIRNAAAWETEDNNISHIDVSESSEANVIDGHTDQLTITINTVDNKQKLISEEAIAINIQLIIDEESMKYAANRFHNTDFLEIDVENEGNEELTDNDDIHTESPLFVDIYPSEIEEFEHGGPESGAEMGISENRTVEIETARDRFGNEIRQPTFDAALEGAETEYTHTGIEIDTDDRTGLRFGSGEEIEPRVGVFDLTVEVTEIEGPATHADGDVTATIEDLAIYPGDVAVEVVGSANDFDAGRGNAELAVDLGVSDADIDRVDVEFRRTDGGGTIAFGESDGTPTMTDLWTDTGYAGDDELRPENAWAIERDLTASDFDEGVRTYALETETPDRYEITADVMPYEGRLVPDDADVRTSTTDAHENATRGTAEIVATGPIDSVPDVALQTDHEFVGVESDAGGEILVEFGAFLDANGNEISRTNETVTVGFGNETIESGVGSGSVTADIEPSSADPAAAVELDPTAIETTAVETGTNATVAIAFEEGRQLNGTAIRLVHRVAEPKTDGSEWHPGSIPQPATLYVDADGPSDLTHWNPATERYESLADGIGGDVFESHHVEGEHLHRGFYLHSADEGARIGLDFVTDEASTNESTDPEHIELDTGWHFGSSNYDISGHGHRELADDVNWSTYGFGEEDGAFLIRSHDGDRIHDRTNGSDIDGKTTAVEHDDAYWIRVRDDDDTPLAREIISPSFTETDGIQE